MKKSRYIFMLPSLWLCACAATTPATQTHTASFGEAVAHNKAAQMIAPTAEQKTDTFIPADRTLQNAARDRYRKDNVKKPTSLRTTR